MKRLAKIVDESLAQAVDAGRARGDQRLADHAAFVDARTAAGKPPGYTSVHHGLGVITRQETSIRLAVPVRIERGDEQVTAWYLSDS